jgi:hypothetical protein
LVWGPGNKNVDPCFAHVGDYSEGIVGDYHLKSQAGRWDSQSNIWLVDAAGSLCIDAGSPSSPLGNETGSPRNKRINMGAYGGTAQASKTPANWSLLADLTNDGIVDQRDFAYQAKDNCAAGGEKPGDLNRNGAVDMDDVATLIGAWLDNDLALTESSRKFHSAISSIPQITGSPPLLLGFNDMRIVSEAGTAENSFTIPIFGAPASLTISKSFKTLLPLIAMSKTRCPCAFPSGSAKCSRTVYRFSASSSSGSSFFFPEPVSLILISLMPFAPEASTHGRTPFCIRDECLLNHIGRLGVVAISTTGEEPPRLG